MPHHPSIFDSQCQLSVSDSYHMAPTNMTCHNEQVALPGLRERKKARTSQALEDAALDLFATKGFDATTIEEIADAVEVSPRTFFRYFASKEEVLFTEDAGRDCDLADFLADRPSSESSLEKLRAALMGWTADYEQDRPRLLRRAQVVHGTPSLTATALAHWQAKEEVVVAALLAADPGADRGETRLVVAVSFAALRVTIEAWLDDGGAGDLPRLAAAALERLSQGLDRRRAATTSHGRRGSAKPAGSVPSPG
jgi:AcrR family transcriptional regulator